MKVQKNIFPIDKQLVLLKEREIINGHRGHVFWFTGLSGSGKSTIAQAVERNLFSKGLQVKILDGDNIRSGINSNLGFSNEDRTENLRRVAELAKIFYETGFITLVSFISPTKDSREKSKIIIGTENLSVVYVNASLATCEKRDIKGLYAKARKGEIKEFTGVSSIYEVPQDAEIVLDTDNSSVEECTEVLLTSILKKIELNGV